jgi:hypothetical protein
LKESEKSSLLAEKLEVLCRELQKTNKKVNEDRHAMVIEEHEKRKEMSEKFGETVKVIGATFWVAGMEGRGLNLKQGGYPGSIRDPGSLRDPPPMLGEFLSKGLFAAQGKSLFEFRFER